LLETHPTKIKQIISIFTILITVLEVSDLKHRPSKFVYLNNIF
jgi:hypothetical protein